MPSDMVPYHHLSIDTSFYPPSFSSDTTFKGLETDLYLFCGQFGFSFLFFRILDPFSLFADLFSAFLFESGSVSSHENLCLYFLSLVQIRMVSPMAKTQNFKNRKFNPYFTAFLYFSK